jgi:hypothetical protein
MAGVTREEFYERLSDAPFAAKGFSKRSRNVL